MPSINTCMSLTTTTNTMSNSNATKVPEVNTIQLQALAEVCSSVNGMCVLGAAILSHEHSNSNFYFIAVGAASMTMPSIVAMNSLLSETKVITNDAIPISIAAAQNTLTLPTIPVPVSSLGIPVMNMKTDDDDDLVKAAPSSANDIEKMEEKTLSDVECVDGEIDKLCDSKKCEAEPMPVEIENEKTGENCCETDIDVGDDGNNIVDNGNRDDKSLLNSAEPMEYASVASFASPKHTMTTDVVMAESVSVRRYLE